MIFTRRAFLLGAAAMMSAVSSVANASIRSMQKGTASWYGGKFHGRKTASGERFNKHALTAAHRSLPFGSKVRVTNQRNNRMVIVRINDRGPFLKNRVIDLSEAAAEKIGMRTSGTAPVRVEILG